MAEYVVVQTEAAATKTASGLYLPEGAAEKPKVATVMAVGSEVKNVKVGEKVIYKNEYEATTVKIDGTEYILVYVKNIIATTK
jgi:chaperonin GroES